jgi:uncharacterized protein YjiS (DUF1127 family)
MKTSPTQANSPLSLRLKLRQWQTRKQLMQLDNLRLKDIGVNRWDLKYAQNSIFGEQTGVIG